MSSPAEADFIFVPLLDGRYALGQIEAPHEGSADALFTHRTSQPGQASMIWDSDVIARLRVPAAPLESGDWPTGGHATLPWLPKLDADRPVQEQAIVEAFMSAVHGLFPWDGFGRRDFFDDLLIDPQDTRPIRTFAG